MATAEQIAVRALKRLGIPGIGGSLAAEEMQDSLEALSAMLASWEAEGVVAALPIDDRFEQGVVAMLAVRVSEDYGKTVGQVLARDAAAGWQQIQAHYITPGTVEFDPALSRTPTRLYVESYGINGTRAWRADTAWGLADLVTNAGNVYVCIVAGVSGATGPTGTTLNQADGSCVWDYVQAIGG